MFDYETPLCIAFKEFNYLLQIDPNVLTDDVFEIKNYEEYKNDWIYEWNDKIPWVSEKPWKMYGVWKEPVPVRHHCDLFYYKTGCSEWPTCNWRDDGFCNGGNLPGQYVIDNQIHYQDEEWYEALEDCEMKTIALYNKAEL